MGIAISNNSNRRRHRLRRVNRYVCIGASDAVGIGARNPSRDGWVPVFSSLISARRTINLGRSGSTLHDAMRQQLPKVFHYRPDVITIWLAVNDFSEQLNSRSILNSYRSDLNSMLFQLRTRLNKNTRILVGNIPDLSKVITYKSSGIPSLLLKFQVKRWNRVIKDAVKANDCDLVDLYSGWRELGEHPEYISPDGFHPSKAGYRRIAQAFYQEYLK
jgi:acyl-CoA thioesterase I